MMKLWYWFLIILFFISLILTALGYYHYYQLKEYSFGWELLVFGAIGFAVLLAVGLLYFQRYVRRWSES